jgi:hypothetical protein
MGSHSAEVSSVKMRENELLAWSDVAGNEYASIRKKNLDSLPWECHKMRVCLLLSIRKEATI